MKIIEAILYGLLQGVAEFLPISSSGHLALAQNFFGAEDIDSLFFFNILLHIATLLAVFIVYYKDIGYLFKGFFGVCGRAFSGEKRKSSLNGDERLFIMICIATAVLVPAALLDDKVEALSGVSWAIGALLLVNGVMLFVSDRLNRGDRSLADAPIISALYIGLFQFAGILPGISRSGATITGGLINGLKREDAVKFSFLMSIPAILGAAVLELPQIGGDLFAEVSVSCCAAGMIAALVSGVAAIKILQFFARRNSFTPFAVYSVLAGAAAIAGDLITR